MMFSTRENTSRWMNRYKNYSQEKHSPKAKREIVACFVKVRQKQKVGRNNSSGNVLVVRTIRRITKLSKLINSNEFLHLLWNCVIHFHFFSLSLSFYSFIVIRKFCQGIYQLMIHMGKFNSLTVQLFMARVIYFFSVA